MSVRLCRDGDIQGCLKLWKACFGDDDFADFYFSYVHRNDNALVFECDSQIAGHLASIPFEADVFGNSVSCRYIYGVSVLPEFRNRGIMRCLMEAVPEEGSSFKLLIPAVENLYERFGFSVFTCKKDIVVNNTYGTPVECYDIQHLNGIYDCYRSQYDISLNRSSDWWNLIVRAAKLEGFRIFANEGSYAFVKDGYISEFAYTSEKSRDSLAIGDGMLHLPASMATGGLCSENNYLALMLD